MNPKNSLALLRRSRWWAAAGLAVVVAVVAVVVLNSGDPTPTAAPARATTGDPGGPSATPSASSSRSSTSPSPHTTASGTSTARPGKKTGKKSSIVPATDANAGRPHAHPARFTATVPASKQVTVQIGKVEAITSQAELPGETSRPALRITVVASNDGDKPVSIKTAIVNAYYGKDRTPATSVLKPGSKWFPQSIRSHGEATGIFVFNIPVQDRKLVDLEVDLDTGLKIVTFRGPVQPQA